MRLSSTLGRLALFVVLAVTTAACGSSRADDVPPSAALEQATTTSTTATNRSDDPAENTSVGRAPTTTSSTVHSSSSASSSALAPAQVPAGPGPKGQLEMKASLAESCVRPGGTQTITVLIRPKSGVGYDTVYSDGKSGMMEGHYGGNFGGIVDESGKWSHSWVITPNAPAGKVQVNVLGGHMDYGHAQATLYFTVAGTVGRCD
jgi:hypothetical protein